MSSIPNDYLFMLEENVIRQPAPPQSKTSRTQFVSETVEEASTSQRRLTLRSVFLLTLIPSVRKRKVHGAETMRPPRGNGPQQQIALYVSAQRGFLHALFLLRACGACVSLRLSCGFERRCAHLNPQTLQAEFSLSQVGNT